MKKITLVSILALAAEGWSAAGNSPVESLNLFRNGNFEAGKEMPQEWSFWAFEPWLFSVKRVSAGGRSGAYLQLDEKVSTVMSAGMLGQEVKVKPNAVYRVGVWARLRGGCATIYVSRADGRCDRLVSRISWSNSDLLPGFLSPEDVESSNPEEWFWLGGEIKTDPGEDRLTVQLATFGERSSIDFDDATMEQVSEQAGKGAGL